LKKIKLNYFTTRFGRKGARLGGKYTVTRIDVIFSYPDRVPLTHFVHRAKKVFSM
jgi:hypothetical protein